MKTIEEFLSYCEESQEQKGKNDALINSDSSYMFENLEGIVQEAIVKLLPLKIYYEDCVTDMNMKIENFKRFGLVDTVEQYTAQKKNAEKKLLWCQDAETYLKNTIETYHQNGGDIRKLDWGVVQMRMSTYARGFQQG